MLEHHLDETDGILTVKPSGRLAVGDFAARDWLRKAA